MAYARPLVGFLVLMVVAWLISNNRRHFPLKTVVGGILLQGALAFLLLKTDGGIWLFQQIAELVMVIFAGTQHGARFVFGPLVDAKDTPWGFVFAVQALPAIIVFSSLSALGYHLGVLQRVVMGMAWVMRRTLFISGAESLSAAGNVFLGQTEAPLLVRPYIGKATFSELNAIMVGGFATVQGSLIAVYASMLGLDHPDAVNEFARHLLTASLISAPAGVVIAKIMVPERETPETAKGAKLDTPSDSRNAIDAVASGAADGLKLALNVAAMLIAFLAIIFLIDHGLNWIGETPWVAPKLEHYGIASLSLSTILGWIFWPIAWLIGIPSAECSAFGSLLGLAMGANEFIAYASLKNMIAADTITAPNAKLAVYALCGFANFSSIAIQLGGISGMAPNRRPQLAALGLRAMLGGAMACWMTACIASLMT
jgi:CNT family concentrative nucleoside transporter